MCITHVYITHVYSLDIARVHAWAGNVGPIDRLPGEFSQCLHSCVDQTDAMHLTCVFHITISLDWTTPTLVFVVICEQTI